jgi:hypothetical protein
MLLVASSYYAARRELHSACGPSYLNPCIVQRALAACIVRARGAGSWYPAAARYPITARIPLRYQTAARYPTAAGIPLRHDIPQRYSILQRHGIVQRHAIALRHAIGWPSQAAVPWDLECEIPGPYAGSDVTARRISPMRRTTQINLKMLIDVIYLIFALF